jgi:Tfp pilus assembly protein PilF
MTDLPDVVARPRRKWPFIALAIFVVAAVIAGLFAAGAFRSESAAELLARGLREQVDGRTDAAERDFRAVLAKDPSNKFAYYNLGLIAQNHNDNVKAENAYRAAISIDATYWPALFNLAILRVAANDATEAVRLYREVIKANPTYASAHLNLGYLLKSLGKIAEGDAELEIARSLAPALSGSPTPSPS